MLGTILCRYKNKAPELLTSRLFNQETFYPTFLKDLNNCKSEVIIESPFITHRRLNKLMPTLQKLKSRKVRIIINTRDPRECEDEYQRGVAFETVSKLQHLGVHVLYTGRHHRKLAIIDKEILYEGSLNILSQNDSAEIMRRIESVQLAWEMIRFNYLDNF